MAIDLKSIIQWYLFIDWVNNKKSMKFNEGIIKILLVIDIKSIIQWNILIDFENNKKEMKFNES